MSFSSFTMTSAIEEFGLTVTTSETLFEGVPPVDVGQVLPQYLNDGRQLAWRVNTEKARSEWMISPVLLELWKRSRSTIYVLSGVDFSVDKQNGLSGVVDFLVGYGPQLTTVTAPIIAIVEGKNESIPNGQGQCAAEMVAALRFNHQAKTNIDTVYGVVTTGDNWLFHRLHGTTFAIDTREYLISEVDQILGNLLHIVGRHPAQAK